MVKSSSDLLTQSQNRNLKSFRNNLAIPDSIESNNALISK